MGISRLYLDSCEQSQLNRFLQDSGWSREKVSRARLRITRSLLEREGAEESYVIVDDTLLRRAEGVRVEGTAVHHAGKGCCIRGHCLVTSHLVSGDLSLPLGLRLYDKGLSAADGTGASKVALACDLIRQSSLPDSGRVVFLTDSWYFRKQVVAAAALRGWDWVCAVRADRKAWFRGTYRRISRLRPAARQASGDDAIGSPGGPWRAHCNVPGVGPVQVVSWQRSAAPGPTRWLVTNRLDWDPATVIMRYRRRACIETFYWEGKQFLGLDDYRGRKAVAALSHWELVLCAYTMLTAMDLHRPRETRLRTIGHLCQWVIERAALENMRRAYDRGRLGMSWDLLKCAEEPALYLA